MVDEGPDCAGPGETAGPSAPGGDIRVVEALLELRNQVAALQAANTAEVEKRRAMETTVRLLTERLGAVSAAQHDLALNVRMGRLEGAQVELREWVGRLARMLDEMNARIVSKTLRAEVEEGVRSVDTVRALAETVNVRQNDLENAIRGADSRTAGVRDGLKELDGLVARLEEGRVEHARLLVGLTGRITVLEKKPPPSQVSDEVLFQWSARDDIRDAKIKGLEASAQWAAAKINKVEVNQGNLIHEVRRRVDALETKSPPFLAVPGADLAEIRGEIKGPKRTADVVLGDVKTLYGQTYRLQGRVTDVEGRMKKGYSELMVRMAKNVQEPSPHNRALAEFLSAAKAPPSCNSKVGVVGAPNVATIGMDEARNPPPGFTVSWRGGLKASRTESEEAVLRDMRREMSRALSRNSYLPLSILTSLGWTIRSQIRWAKDQCSVYGTMWLERP